MLNSALAMSFCRARSLSSMSLTEGSVDTAMVREAVVGDCIYRELGEGVVAEDEGVAMLSGLRAVGGPPAEGSEVELLRDEGNAWGVADAVLDGGGDV